METNDITLEQLDKAVRIMENYSREPQKVSEILPLVMVVLKEKAKDMEQSQKDKKFYAPVWVRNLLNRISAEDSGPLSDEECFIFKDMVNRLSMDDYKSANQYLFGYEVQYTTPQQINETILALKHCFGLI